MGKASPMPVPARVEDLSREGAIFLLGILAPVIRRSDLASARWHELVRAAERASRAHSEAAKEADRLEAACPPWSAAGSRAYHSTRATAAAARQKEERLWRASERAYAAADKFYKAHIQPAPRSTAPAAEEHA